MHTLDSAHHLSLQELDAALFSLDSFQHIAFTSRNAVAGTLSRLAALHSAAGRSSETTDTNSGSSSSGTSGGGINSGSSSGESSSTNGGTSIDFGGKAAAALGSCGAVLWALGADAGALRDAGVEDVQVPQEVGCSTTSWPVAAIRCCAAAIQPAYPWHALCRQHEHPAAQHDQQYRRLHVA